MSDNNNININTPDIGPYTHLQPFRFWCQKVLPLVYDESLSYYELLCKVVDYLNKTMEDVDQMITDMGEFKAADTEFKTEVRDTYIAFSREVSQAVEGLESFVNNYFNNLNVQTEINNKLDAMAEAGYFSDLFTALFTDDIITEAGSVTSAWIAANLLQETGYVIDNSLTVANAAADAKATGDAINLLRTDTESVFEQIVQHTKNLFVGKMEQGSISGTTGENTDTTPEYYVRTAEHTPIEEDTAFTLSWVSNMNRILVYYYAADKSFLSYVSETVGSEGSLDRKTKTLTPPANAAYIRVRFSGSSAQYTYTPEDISQIQVEEGTNATPYENPLTAWDKKAESNINSINETIERIGAERFNLIDLETLEADCYYSGGTRTTQAGFSATDYIPIEGGKTYCAANYRTGEPVSTHPIIEWYDSSKTYILWANNLNPITFPVNAAFCRISYQTAYFPYLVFLEESNFANMPDTWIPYSVDVKKLASYNPADVPALSARIKKLEDPDYNYAIGNIICIGDSLTDGLYVPNGQGVYEYGLIKQNYPYYLQRMLTAEVENAGKNGSHPENWYQNYYSLYDFSDYDTAIIWLGTNGGLDYTQVGTSGTQAYYYQQIIDGIKTQNPNIEIILLTVFTTGPAHSEVNYPNATTTNAAISDFAENESCYLIDMSDLGYSNNPKLHNNINNTHFGKAGNIFIADRISKNLKDYFNADPLRCEFGIMSK